jgi:hypothetical protein
MSSITSADGTTISYDRVGNGPPVILVLGAFNDRAAGAPLAAHMSAALTVVNFAWAPIMVPAPVPMASTENAARPPEWHRRTERWLSQKAPKTNRRQSGGLLGGPRLQESDLFLCPPKRPVVRVTVV